MPAESKQEVQISKTSGEAGAKPRLAQAPRPLTEMERLFDRLMEQSWPFARGWNKPLEWNRPWWNELFDVSAVRTPNVDVVDRDVEIFVRVEVPGVDKNGLEISLVENALTVKGQVHQEEQEEKGDYHWHEIACSQFARTVTLPAPVDATKVSAVLKNGVLEITLPKMETSKRHSIAIQELR